MSLTICRECGRDVSADALVCPHCGANNPAGTMPSFGRMWGFEWRSQTEILGWPLVHVALGRNAQGRLRVAKGVIAVGQFGVGLITVAQFGVGLLFGFGQLILGLSAVAQVALTAYFAVGQVAVGYVAIGQIGMGEYVLAQLGYGRHLWTQKIRDPAAVAFFQALWESLKTWRP